MNPCKILLAFLFLKVFDLAKGQGKFFFFIPLSLISSVYIFISRYVYVFNYLL